MAKHQKDLLRDVQTAIQDIVECDRDDSIYALHLIAHCALKASAVLDYGDAFPRNEAIEQQIEAVRYLIAADKP
jgi:hypothetical protein